MTKPPVSEQVQVNFRMPVELRDRIRAEADSHGRSMNAEIIMRLEATLEIEKTMEAGSVSPSFVQDVANFTRTLEELKTKIEALSKTG